MRNIYASVLAAITAISGLPALAQYYGIPAARSAFEEGRRAKASGRDSAAIAAYRKAISLDPDYAEAHGEYMFTRLLEVKRFYLSILSSQEKPTSEEDKKVETESNRVTDSLRREYEGLAKTHPNKPVYPWALGQLYYESNPLREEEYCRRAVQIDAAFGPGYECLSSIANLRGDEEHAIAFKRKVMELEPDNVDIAFAYSTMLVKDPSAYKIATMQLVSKFPDSPKAAQALFWYGIHQKDDATKVQVFEQLRKEFPPDKFSWSSNGVAELLGIYDRTDTAKAKALVHQMADANPKDEQWTKYAAYVDSMAKVELQINQKNGTAALATLNAIKAPGHPFDSRHKDLLNARALEAAGQVEEAYSNLLRSYVKHPTDDIHTAVVEYGAKLGKSVQEIEAQIWSDIKRNSTPAIPFSLEEFTSGKQTSLASYAGYVVIVDFWYPNCGPCRAAFPYLEQLAIKYKEKGLVVLAINGMEGQEEFVLPLMKSKGYDFIPLRGNERWARDVYQVRGYPSTFLVGADGRLYYRPYINDDEDERATEIEIEELLAHSRQ
jgi:thiol-disulfide isomerase/thioredoxin/TolA-binding protein